MPSRRPLSLHPDRLFPADPGTRQTARRLYEAVRELPIISPHGHVPPQWLTENDAFTDPTSLLITPDHYVNRLLHAQGVSLDRLGVGRNGEPLPAAEARAAWRLLCEHWSDFRATPVRYWFEDELVNIFGVSVQPSAETADEIYDQISAALATEAFRPRALFDQFKIDVLATTDDPCDDLEAHQTLRKDADFRGRVIPTFRPDRYLEPERDTWNDDVDLLAKVSGIDAGDYAGYIAALENRRRYFVENGATSSDHSHPDVQCEPLSNAEADRIFTAARSGRATPTESTAFRRHMINEMARMACDDGLVMTLHPAVFRNHHPATLERYGADVGSDIPLAVEFTRSLQPMLSRYGTHPNFHLILFTIDEDTYSRELAPLAGFYPSVYVGAPWWFIDAPDAIRRYRSAVTETIGFSRTSGFIDDTRAFCSIPARHDMSRRIDSGYLAELVAQHRLGEDEAMETAIALVQDNPRKAFRLEDNR